jgi:hypothetical protein
VNYEAAKNLPSEVSAVEVKIKAGHAELKDTVTISTNS